MATLRQKEPKHQGHQPKESCVMRLNYTKLKNLLSQVAGASTLKLMGRTQEETESVCGKCHVGQNLLVNGMASFNEI